MLAATLSVAPEESAWELTLTVENTGTKPVELRFRDSQHADFVAVDVETGKEVWRWSEGRMFTQALESTELAPGDAVSYDGTWTEPPDGSYRIEGELAASNHDATAEMTVEL